MILAGGFVLGEVLGLQDRSAIEVIWFIVLTAGILTAFFGMSERKKTDSVYGNGNKRIGIWKQFRIRTGRSLWIWLLPVFLWGGYERAGAIKTFCEQERALGIDGRTVTLSGTVLRRSEREADSFVLILGDCVGEDFQIQDFQIQKLQVYVDLEENRRDVQIGSRVSVTGRVCLFEEPRNPGEFDYRLYACSQKMNYRMFADQLVRTGGRCRMIRETIASVREKAGGILLRIAEEKDGGVYRAVILGDSSFMDEELYALYQEQGTAHLLAVSGLHLSLLSAAVYGGLRKTGTGYGLAGLTGAMVLMLYAVLTGEAASVLRAMIMGICGFAAAYFGRTYDLMSAWSLALVMLLWDSPYRMFQAGVQLSFGALAGIGWLAPKLQKLAEIRLKGKGKNRDGSIMSGVFHRIFQTFLVSFSMQLVTLPILLYHYFQYPVYGMFLNFLMVPLMGIVVASGTAGIFCGAVHWKLGKFALGCGHMVLSWYELCCRAGSQLPGSVLTAGRPGYWKIGIYYGILWVIARKCTNMAEEKPKEKQKAKILLLGCTAVLLLVVRLPSVSLKVTFLDVGQGDGILVQSGRTAMLIDGGSTDQKQLGKYTLVPFLKSQGISKLDYAVVSHGDEDHISGLSYLLETGEIPIENLVLPAPGKGEPVYEKLSECLRKAGGQVFWMERGDRLNVEPYLWGKDLDIFCLSPSQEIPAKDRNEHSLVLKLDYGNLHMLLTGDMSSSCEEELMSYYDPEYLKEIQILKVAHHGSDTSTGETWIQTLQPVWAVISYGENNRYGHPDPEVLQRLRTRKVHIFETAKNGAAGMETDGKMIRWENYLP